VVSRTLPVAIAIALVSASLARGAPKASPTHWVDKTTGGLPADPLTVVAVDPFSDSVIYAGNDGGVFRSDDGGATFAPIFTFPRGTADDPTLSTDDTDGTSFNESTTAVVDTATVDANDAADDANDDGLDDDALPEGSLQERRRTGDEIPLVPLTDLTVPPRIEAGARSIVFVPQSKGALLVATPRGLYRSTNAGLSFERLSIPGGIRENDIRDVVIDALRPSRYFVGTAAGLFVSKDGGASFARGNGRVGSTGVVCLAAAADSVVVGTERGLVRSRDAGETFNDLLLRGSAAFPIIHAVAVADGGATVYAGVSAGLFAAIRDSAILENYEGMPDEPPTAILPDPREVNGLILATRSGDGGTFFSNDIGLTTVEHEPLPANQVYALARETRDPNRLWAATERGLFRLETGTGIRISRDELEELRARFATEPDLREITERAIGFSSGGFDGASAQARAGWANLLPVLNAGYQFDAGDTNQTRTEFLFVVGVGQPPTSDPTAEFTDRFNNGLLVLQPSQQIDHRFWINLTWDLDRVILAPSTTQVNRNATISVANDLAVADEVRRLYVMRRRLMAQMALDSKKSTTTKQHLDRIHKELEVLEVEAHLAGLVGADLFDADSADTGPPVREKR